MKYDSTSNSNWRKNPKQKGVIVDQRALLPLSDTQLKSGTVIWWKKRKSGAISFHEKL